MKILSLDCATECATVAILEDDKLIGEISFNYKKQHSVILMPMIDEVLKNTSLNINDIDGFVVSKGPGSFTGLRVGMATIKGLVQASKKPFISVSTLEGLANNLFYADGLICPIMDALRGNLYTALYKFEGDNLTSLVEPMVISLEELITTLKEKNEPVYFIGDGVYKFKEKLINELENIKFAPSHLNLARAASLGQLGRKYLNNGIEDDVYAATPIYLRLSQAEREYEEKMKSNG